MFTCYGLCLCEKRRWVWVKWVSFPPSWKGLKPSSASDVRCVPLCSRNFDTHQACFFKMQKTRNFGKIYQRSFLKQWLHRAYEWWANVISLQQGISDVIGRICFQPFPRWRKLNTEQTKWITTKQRIFSWTTTVILQSYKKIHFSVVSL